MRYLDEISAQLRQFQESIIYSELNLEEISVTLKDVISVLTEILKSENDNKDSKLLHQSHILKD